MHVLKWLLQVLRISGYSRPSSWTSPFKKFLYNMYTVFAFLTMHLFVIAEILDLVLVVDNQNEFSENLYTTTAMILTCFKMAGLITMKKNLETLVNILSEEPFRPMNTEEAEIQMKFDKIATQKGKAYLCMVGGWVIWAHSMSLIIDSPTRKLLYRTWLPFDHTTLLGYSIASAYQLMTSMVCTATNTTYDSLFSGLLIHIYSQFEILNHRLHNIHGDENNSVKQCARHHDLIYKFSNMVNKEFKTVMFLQFLMTTVTLCFDMYQLSRNTINAESTDMVLYACCTLVQIYYYCWHGNEVKLKSLEVPDMIFDSDWTRLSISAKKILLLMMNRAVEPIEFTSLYLVTINLESFKALVKTSYSVFNLLQQTN